MTALGAATCEIRRQRDLPVLIWPAFGFAGSDILVTTTAGGVSSGPYATLNLSLSVHDDASHVLANRRRVAAALDADLDRFVFARQVHGARARIIRAADRGRGTLTLDDAIPAADALVTSDPGTVLAVLVGDCVPIVLLDPVAGVLACVHAGWRGTVAGVSGAALSAMATLGARPDRVLAGLGPAIAPDRYQVGDEVAARVRQAFAGGTGLLRPDGTGKWLLNLWEANRRALIEAGLPDGQIHIAAMPTGEGMFFSDRTARPCGRFALVARLTTSQSA